MLVVLALYACGRSADVVPPAPRAIPEPESPPLAAIATVPAHGELRRADVIPSPLPAGQPVVRTECFGGLLDELGYLGSRGGGAGPGGGAPRASAPRPAPTPPQAIRPRPARRPQDPAKESDDLGGVEGGVVNGVITGEEQTEKPQTELARPDAPKEDEDRKTVSAPTDDPEPRDQKNEENGETEHAAKSRGFDWGATVYLSNDDSMSLASAQRMLYALSHGVRLKPSEIRPHELLNYFSFDTVAPPEGQTFGVLGGARQSGDTLTVSLAVRGANPARQPLDLTVLLDRSCSMSAEDRMGYTRRGLHLLSDNLQRGDRVNVVLFDSSTCTPLENYVVGRDDPKLLTSVIDQLQPTSGTNLDAGLAEAYRVQTSRDAADTHGRNRRVLLVTDALLNEGNVDANLVTNVGTQLDQHGIRLSGIGVGRDFNDAVLDRLTEKGRGAYVYLGSEAVVDRVFGPGFDALVRTVAHDVQFSLDLPDSLAMERFYGEEASTDAADVKPITYHAGTTQLFLQDLEIKDGAVRREDPIVLHIAYKEADTMERRDEELHTTVGALLDADPHNLEKGQALMAFADWTSALAVGADPCGASLAKFEQRASPLADDAEIGFVNGLVGARCGVPLATAVPAGVELKVKVDADIPVSGAKLSCGGRSQSQTLSGSDTVARFTSVQPGACRLELAGTIPMSAEVQVPQTGADLRCTIRGGRLSCS